MLLGGNRKDGAAGHGMPGGGDRGSSMIYVVLFVTLLTVFSCGYMTISKFNMQSTLNSRRYMEAQLTAKTIHRTFCESVGGGESDVMNSIWQCFESDRDMVREEYEEMMADEEENEDAAEDDAVEDDAAKDDAAEKEAVEDSAENVDERVEAAADGEADGSHGHIDGRWERYLYHALGNKEYVMKGTSGQPDEDVSVDITVKAIPLARSANVSTKVVCNGYTFSLKADIVFDHSDGAVIDRGNMYRRSRGERVYLDGNGVYRYYEEGDE